MGPAVRFTTRPSACGAIWTAFQHQAFLVARVPRVRCFEHGVRQRGVPWRGRAAGPRCCSGAGHKLGRRDAPVAAVRDLLRDTTPASRVSGVLC